MSGRMILVAIGLILLVLAALPLPVPLRLEWGGVAALAAAYFLT